MSILHSLARDEMKFDRHMLDLEWNTKNAMRAC